MKFASNILRRFVDIPADARDLRELLDDVGIEVKRVEPAAWGTVFTAELLANRGDHYCYHGVARELSGRTGAAVRLPPVATLTVGSSPVRLANLTDRCLLYSATLLLRGDAARNLGGDELAALEAAEIHSISASVDATNLANLELGQPTHAFDAEKIVGGITIRLSAAGETALPLFAESRVELPEGTLVIADDEKILAVAGVIGCEESKATEATTLLLLESAAFDPVAVRKASRALGLHTDSSARFERGSDPSAVLTGAGRVVHLLEGAGWKRQGTTGLVGDWQDPKRVIHLEIPATATFLEHPLTADDVALRLGRYGFEVSPPYPDWSTEDGWAMPAALDGLGRERLRNSLLVRVPPHRLWDVEFAADLHEELAKSIGYNATPEHLPTVDLGMLPSPAEVARYRTEDLLVGAGFYEIFTDGFYSRDQLARVGIGEGHPLTPHVETKNALDRGYSLLKNNALIQAVEVVAESLRRRNEQIKAYEWTRTFHPDADARNGVCTERRLLWAIACGQDVDATWAGKGRPADALYLKGLLQELAVQLGLPFTLAPSTGSEALYSLLHPGRQARILLGGRTVGMLGEVHPAVCRGLRIKRARPSYFEISAEAIEAPGSAPTYEEPSDLHPILRSLAFTLPGRVEAGQVAACLADAGPNFLEDVRIVDLFTHEEDGKPLRTVTYELVYTSEDSPRTADEVNRASEYLIEAVSAKFGSQGVRLR